MATASQVQMPNTSKFKELAGPHSVRELRASAHSLVSDGRILRDQASLKAGTSVGREV